MKYKHTQGNRRRLSDSTAILPIQYIQLYIGKRQQYDHVFVHLLFRFSQVRERPVNNMNLNVLMDGLL